ncbi:MAG: methylated-DNA--[protein]-cysteine S-methyltransferase [Oscillospiraceae bacterium]|nr:methylated-DNA--[protein]-cysteine S-methyltransferase [Oscillospiraceae bacterium]
MLYYTEYPSPVGLITVAADGENIVGVWIEGQRYYTDTPQKTPALKENTAVLREAAAWLDRYFAGEKPSPYELPLAPAGNEFRKAVWKRLCEIPYGEVTSYKAIAQKVAADLGKERMSAQAVGGAVGHNPISIIIPCHRVVGANGNLTGYGGGMDRKIQLLTFENVDMSALYRPKDKA